MRKIGASSPLPYVSDSTANGWEQNSPEANAQIRALNEGDFDKPSLALLIWFECVKWGLVLLVGYVLLRFSAPLWLFFYELFGGGAE